MIDVLEDVGLGPVRQLAVAVGSIVGATLDLALTGGDLLLGVSDLLFSMTALAQGTLGARVGWIDQELAQQAFLFVAGLYLLHLLFSLYDRLTEDTST